MVDVRVVLPASPLLLLVFLLWLLGRDGGDPNRDERTPARRDVGPPPGAEALLLQAPTLHGRPADVSSRQATEVASREAFVALAVQSKAAWDVQLALIEGTPGLADAELLNLIATDDGLYRTWLEVNLSFDGPAVAPLDLDVLGRLAAAFRRYREQPGTDSRLLDVLGEIEGRLRTTEALHIPVELVDETLPRWIAYLSSREEGRTPSAGEALLFQECARLVRDHLEGSRSLFPALLELHARVLERRRVVRESGIDVGTGALEEPWSRWRGDLGRLLLVPSAPLDDGVLQRIHAACSALAIVANVPERDLDRVLMRGVTLQDLADEGEMARQEVSRIARDHVDRFLTFLSLLEVEMAYGRQRLFPSGPDNSGARLYFLASALHARSRLPRGTGPITTWLTDQSNDRIAEELAKRHPDLAQAREAAWEFLAGELQGLVSGALK